MKPQLLKVSAGPAQSFSVRQDLIPCINNRWHYHPEIELIHFKKGSGTQFVGDNIRPFNAGDIVMIGAYLPHYWRFDDVYFAKEETAPVDIRVAHFCENFWGNGFLQLPENKMIKTVLEKARRGIQITGRAKNAIAGIMENLLTAEGSKRIILLMEALNIIAGYEHADILSSIGFSPNMDKSGNDCINVIYEYSLANFKNKIHMDELADLAGISPNSFCRYFKSRTRKTYSKFLLEIRVGHACKLLIENRLPLKQLCYESGFNNFTNFHKYFKQITGKSPLNYQREFIQTKTSSW
ncbi:AraC family transcriptional regulator [Mucilaginibacter sp. HC2]|uniref:AraC family transcriptional regulator n=1 Tax=Mucilaginibacter inviolabilis TaxID=2714892 RepID=UPI00140BD186|nr:helix-turn-helix domain-containing protein [Mucilaginibacter inviolabilis]NHA07827.1 AraC family transcriptional regulator [Mucilaginibacter inviolabilis]